MQRLINNLREKSDDEKKAIAMFSSVAIVTVLFAGWGVTSFGLFERSKESQTASASNAAGKSGILDSVTGAAQGVNDAYQNSMEELKKIQQKYPKDDKGTVVNIEE